MRTGLPCIATNYSGQTDFMDDTVAYMIGYKMGEGIVTFIGDKHQEKTHIAFPDVAEMAKWMIYIRQNYKEALKVGERASKRIKSKFTWPQSARTLVSIMEQQHGIH